MRGRYAGAWATTWAMGFAFGATAGTLVFAWNAPLLWVGCAFLGVVGAALMAVQPPARPVEPEVIAV